MTTAGIDVGSVTTKVVLLDNGRVVSQHLVPTKADPNLAAQTALYECLKISGLSAGDIRFTISTAMASMTCWGVSTVTEVLNTGTRTSAGSSLLAGSARPQTLAAPTWSSSPNKEDVISVTL